MLSFKHAKLQIFMDLFIINSMFAVVFKQSFMPIFTCKSDLKNCISQIKGVKSIGFVPTMGALHKGHSSLIEKSVSENQVVVVSIFVNPTQFDQPQDLLKYPKTIEKDVRLIKSISDSIIVFIPEVETLYDREVKSEAFDFGGLESRLEGKFRKGHFDGVATVVSKLFDIVQPDKAYFGEKDYQQLLVIKRLVMEQNRSIQVIGCPIIRESNGLAMSSRNQRLTHDQRERSKLIYDCLQEVKEKVKLKQDLPSIHHWVEVYFKQDPDFQLEYFHITEEQSLQEIEGYSQEGTYRAFIAVYVAGIRLIDNLTLN